MFWCYVINSLSTAFSTTQLVLECILAGTGVSFRWYRSNTYVVLNMHSNSCFLFFFRPVLWDLQLPFRASNLTILVFWKGAASHTLLWNKKHQHSEDFALSADVCWAFAPESVIKIQCLFGILSSCLQRMHRMYSELWRDAIRNRMSKRTLTDVGKIIQCATAHLSYFNEPIGF